MSLARLGKLGALIVFLGGAASQYYSTGAKNTDISHKKVTEVFATVDADIQAQVKKLTEQNVDMSNREEIIEVVCSKQLPVMQQPCKSLFDRYYTVYKAGKGADIDEYVRSVIEKKH